MMHFFIRNWAGACWGRWAGTRAAAGWSEGSGLSGRGRDCCYADRLALDLVHLCKKNQKEEGSAGASLVAAPMPKSVSSSEKRLTAWRADVLHMFAYKSAYLSPMGWPCIYSRCSTSWMVTRIRSHWVGYFCYYRYQIW